MDVDTSTLLAVPPKNHRQTRIQEHLKSIKRSASPLDRQQAQPQHPSGKKSAAAAAAAAGLSAASNNSVTPRNKDKSTSAAMVTK